MDDCSFPFAPCECHVGWEELDGFRPFTVEYFEFFQRLGLRTVPWRRDGTRTGSSDHNLQLLQLLIQQCRILHNSEVADGKGEYPMTLRAPRLQNKGGQQDVDVQMGLVSAE